MLRVEYAPDEELHEKLEFEWPEESGLTLEDFEVYRMYDRPHANYVPYGPLWMAVHEPQTITRRLGREWLFVASNKLPEEVHGLHFVRATVSERTLGYTARNTKGWSVPMIGLQRNGYLFQDEDDATYFHLWRGPANENELHALLKKIGYG